jgi:hypothetical protein
MAKVLFIAGWLRSGTTVTGNVLGSAPSAVHIGELNYLWMKEHPAGFECGCGEIIFDCPVWKPVLDRLGMTTERRMEIRALRRERWRNDDTPKRYVEWKRGRPDLRYPAALADVYRGLTDQPGVDLVVDSTKNASDALAAAMAPGVDLHLLHVVRDPRAAAYSGMQEKTHGSGETGHQMVRFSPSRNTFHWDVRNLLIERCARRVVPADRYRRVRYEDLMAAPREEFSSIAEWVGVDPVELPFTGPSTVKIAQSHTVMGNPNRHTGDKEVELRLDTRWVEKLGGRDAATATLVASPLMTRYGYSLRRSKT